MNLRPGVDREVAHLHLPDGRLVERVVEVRTHPLSGETSRILPLSFRPLKVPDIRSEYASSLAGCPFCPEAFEKHTPRFSPSEFDSPLFTAGQANVIPNLIAYSGVCALTVLTREHFVALPELRSDLLLDGFRAARSFFHACRDARPELPVRLLHWNFMPPAGSSILHPHQQLMATKSPPNRLRKLYEGSRRYRTEAGKNPWDELVLQERDSKERWVGAAPPWSWVLDPAPHGRTFELVAVHASKADVTELRDEDFTPLSSSLVQAFAYLASNGFWSFNLAVMGMPDAEDCFRCQVRLVPRAFLPPVGCADVHFDVIEAEPMVLQSPEEVAKELRALFS
jgi:UDPglucose--hexose-1-phosphate uridylyltransferase